MDSFDAVAGDLMLKQGVKASQLHKRLRKITDDASKGLPPLKVLYCDTYGGYGYSDAFETFCSKSQATPSARSGLLFGLEFASNRDGIDEEKDKDSSKNENEDEFRDCIDEKKEKDNSKDKDEFENKLKEGRIRDVQRVLEYGQHLLEEWPRIAQLVRAYVRNDLGTRMKEISLIDKKTESLLMYQVVRDSLAAETGRSDGQTDWNKYFYFDEKADLSVYAPSALEAMGTFLDDVLNKETLDIQKQRDAVLKHMPEAQYQAMLHSRGTKLPEEVEAEKAKARNKLQARLELETKMAEMAAYMDAEEEDERIENWAAYYKARAEHERVTNLPDWVEEREEHERIKKLPFPDAVTEYGEDRYAVWRHQSHFDEEAMRFLCLHPDYTEKLASNGGDVTGALELGLCAASGKHCKLRIKEVPCMVEWSIGEYDGLESICF